MAKIIPIASVILALIAAGSIAYLAWQLTSEELHGSGDGTEDADKDAAKRGTGED